MADYNLNDPQDTARFQLNLMLYEIECAIKDGLALVHREDVPQDAALKLLALRKAMQELDRVTQPGYRPTVKDMALDVLGR